MRTKVDILNGRNKVDFLLRCKLNFKFFCEEMLGYASDGNKITMKPYQVRWVDLAQGKTRLVIEASAGFAKCLPTGVRLKTDIGYKEIQNIKTGDTVWSINDNYKSVPNKVVAFSKNGIKPVYEIKTRTGRKLRCTSNHPLKTIDGWKSLDDGLIVGDRVAITRTLSNLKTKNIDENIIKILAYMIAEGSCTQNGIRFTKKDLKVVDDMDMALFGYNNNHLNKYKPSRNAFYDYGVRGIIPLLKEYNLFNKTAHTKEIPKEIFNLSKQNIRLFLNRLWDCDGTICLTGGKKNYPNISYSTVSERLALDVQSLLLFLDINSSVKRRIGKLNNKEFPYYIVSVESQESLFKFIYEIGTFSKPEKLSNVLNFLKDKKSNPNYDTIPINGIIDKLNNSSLSFYRRMYNFCIEYNKNMSRKKLSNLSKLDSNLELEKLSNSDVYWDIITDIKYIKDEMTYDIEVSNNHNFLANDFITHNSETMGAMYPLWRMYSERNLKILLVSKTRDQSKGNMLNRIKNYIRDNEFLKELFVPKDAETSWNQQEIISKQGHWVKVVPYSTNIRSFRGNLIIADECDDYDDPNIYFEHVASRVFQGGKIILISTPTGSTKLIGQLKDKRKAGKLSNYHFEKTPGLVKKDGSPAYTCKPDQVTKDMLLDCVSIWPEGYSSETLLDKWDEQGKWNFMKNVMVEVIGESEDAIYNLSDILSSFDYTKGFETIPDQDAQYFIGADFAISSGPKADFDAFVVVKKYNDQYIIVHMEEHKGWQRPAKVQRLRELSEQYETEKGCIIVADESNMGTMVMNDLRSLGVYVVAQSFHSAARKKLLQTLSNVIQGKGLVIPRSVDDTDAYKLSETLKDQLTGFHRKISPLTGTEGIYSSYIHDDSICAGTYVNTYNGYKPIEDISVGEKVMTHKGNWKKVISTMSKTSTKDIYKISPFGGIMLEITDNHKIFVVNKNINWRKGKRSVFYDLDLKNLLEVNSQDVRRNKHFMVTPIDRTVINKEYINLKEYFPTTTGWTIENDKFYNSRHKEKRYTLKVPVDKDFCFFIGHFAGDGHIRKQAGMIAFNSSHKKLIKKIKNYLKSLGINSTERTEKNKNSTLLSFCCMPFINLIRSYSNKYIDKQLPDWSMFLTPELQKEILKGYISADGTRVRNQIITASISKKLSYQIRHMFLRNNIVGNIRRNKRHRYEVKNLDQYWVELSEWQTAIFDGVENEYTKNKNSLIPNSKSRIIGDYLVSVIRSIENKKKEVNLYDLQVKDDVSYCVEGFAVRNCAISLAMAVQEAVRHEDMDIPPMY